MELAEIISLSFQFHRLVYISLTQKCPIRCRHCFVESGPTRQEHADLDSFKRWIDGIVKTDAAQAVMFSGGEPLSHPKALRYGLEACLRAERYSIVATSAHWAKSLKDALRVLDSYPRFKCLWISTDTYHKEFVPFSYLRHAVEAAKLRDLYVVFQIVDDPQNPNFLAEFEQEVGKGLVNRDQIYLVELGMVGRAAKELNIQITPLGGTLSQVPDMPCPWIGAPWLHEDGALCACPNLDVHKNRSHPLHLGNLNDEDFGALSRQADQDTYLQALRVFGPRGIAERFPVEEWGWRPSNFRGAKICDLCHSLAAVPSLPDRVRKEVARSQDFSSKIDAMRLLLYAETLHILSRARL